jgi:DNA integrity scanning protein DisA with diadenylate cyclase activity
MRKFGSYARIKSATVDDLDDVEGVGPARAARIRAYLDQFPDIAPTAGLDN